MFTSTRIVDRVEGVSLQAPEVEVLLITDPNGAQEIIYQVEKTAPPETLSSFKSGIKTIERLSRTGFPYVLKSLSPFTTKDLSEAVRYRFIGQQLSELNPLKHPDYALSMVQAVVRTLVAFEDRGEYVALFSARSFSLDDGYRGVTSAYLLDFSSIGQTDDHFKSARLSLAKLSVELFVGSNDAEEQLCRVCSNKGAVSKAIPKGVRKFAKALLIPGSAQVSTFSTALTWLENCQQKQAVSWTVKKPNFIAACSYVQKIPKIPIWVYFVCAVLIISLGTHSYFEVRDRVEKNNYISQIKAGTVIFEDASVPVVSKATKEFREEKKTTRAQKALIEYKLWYLKDCSKCDLRGYHFNYDDDLSNMNLSGADLTEASFSGANVKQTNLSYANLSSAKFSDLHFLETNLDHSILKGAEFEKVFFDGASVRHVEMPDLGIIRMSGVDFSYSILSNAIWSPPEGIDKDRPAVTSQHITFVFKGATLKNFQCRYGDLTGVDFSGADLQNANLRYATLSGANLKGAKLIKADLFRAKLDNANAQNADFTEATLGGALVSNANLSGANFSNASVRNLKGEQTAIIDGASFEGADLKMTDF